MSNEVAVLIKNSDEIRMKIYETESKVYYGYEIFYKLKNNFIEVVKDYEDMKPINKEEYQNLINENQINWFFILNLNSKKLTIQTTYSGSDNNVEFSLEEFELNKIDGTSMKKYLKLIDKAVNQLEQLNKIN